MIYKNILPTNLEDYENCEIINNIKKIDELKNMIIYGKSGFGKTHLKNILINNYLEKNKFLKIINLNIDDDFKKTNEKSTYMLNLLKLSQTKLFIIDNIDKLDINIQIFIKSIIKNYKNIYFLIILNDTSKLIEHFYSFFIMFKLDNNYFNINKKNIINKFQKNINFKLKNKNKNYILNNSNNFYELKKNCIYVMLFKEKSDKYLLDYNSISKNNNNKIINNILNNNLNDNIKYINKLLSTGYSENNIINFIINSINHKNINIKNNITDIILNIEINRINYTYIDLLYLIKKLSIY